MEFITGETEDKSLVKPRDPQDTPQIDTEIIKQSNSPCQTEPAQDNQHKEQLNNLDKNANISLITECVQKAPVTKHPSIESEDQSSQLELVESSSEEDLNVSPSHDLHISESEDEKSEGEHDKSNVEDSNIDDLSLPSSPVRDSGFGFSFDDILKANLEYLSDEDDLFQDNNYIVKQEVEYDSHDGESPSLEENESEDNVSTSEVNNDVNSDSGSESEPKAEHGNIQDATKFWEDRFTSLARDKCVSDESHVHLDSESIGNIQKTKLLWEEKVEAGQNSSSPSSRRRSLDGDENQGVHPSDIFEEEIGNNVQQTKLLWQEMTSVQRNSPSPSKKILEDVNNSSGSELEDSPNSRIQQKKLLWEEMSASTQHNSPNKENEPNKRLTLDVLSEEQKADVGKAKMKFEEIIEHKSSPKVSRRNIRLVSKTEEELEAEFISSDVMLQSISDVSNTKSKWEKIITGEVSTENKDQKKYNGSKVTVSKPDNFVVLRDKFEGSVENVANQNTSSDC